ncbi:MAG TPA: acylneuraminate cytidylyltransferase family protein [Gemmatimonadaceae bacterium]|jgi:N-acylneuraminate cytidylyltransferase
MAPAQAQSGDATRVKRVLAIIPARGGSKGLPKKNVMPLLGRPMMQYTIDAARATPLIDRIIVTTDDEEIARVARECGAEVPFVRPNDLATDLATTEATLQHAVLWMDEHTDFHADVVVFMTINNLFRRHEWVHDAVERLLADDTLDSVFVANKTFKNYWRRNDGRFERLAGDIAYGSRQAREPLYREDTGIALATRADLIRQGIRVGSNVDIVAVDDERTGIDIHDAYDFWLAELVMKEWPMDREL